MKRYAITIRDNKGQHHKYEMISPKVAHAITIAQLDLENSCDGYISEVLDIRVTHVTDEFVMIESV